MVINNNVNVRACGVNYTGFVSSLSEKSKKTSSRLCFHHWHFISEPP